MIPNKHKSEKVRLRKHVLERERPKSTNVPARLLAGMDRRRCFMAGGMGLKIVELVQVRVRVLEVGFVTFGTSGDEQVSCRYRHSGRPSFARQLVRPPPDVIIDPELGQQPLEIP